METMEKLQLVQTGKMERLGYRLVKEKVHNNKLSDYV